MSLWLFPSRPLACSLPAVVLTKTDSLPPLPNETRPRSSKYGTSARLHVTPAPRFPLFFHLRKHCLRSSTFSGPNPARNPHKKRSSTSAVNSSPGPPPAQPQPKSRGAAGSLPAVPGRIPSEGRSLGHGGNGASLVLPLPGRRGTAKTAPQSGWPCTPSVSRASLATRGTRQGQVPFLPPGSSGTATPGPPPTHARTCIGRPGRCWGSRPVWSPWGSAVHPDAAEARAQGSGGRGDALRRGGRWRSGGSRGQSARTAGGAAANGAGCEVGPARSGDRGWPMDGAGSPRGR